MKSAAALIIMSFLLINITWSQNTGELKGIITEENGKTPIPFANIVVEKNGKLITGQSTDIDGNFWIKPLAVDSYTVRISSAGLPTMIYNNLKIRPDEVTFLFPKMKADVTMKEFVVTSSKIKIDPGNITGTFNRKDIMNNPSTTTLGIVNVTAGVFSRDGAVGQFSGSREGATIFIDGVQVRNANVSTITITKEDIQRIPSNMGEADVVGALLTTPGVVSSKDNKLDQFEDEEYSTIEENRFCDPLSTPLSTFSIDVDRASYSNVRRMIRDGMKPEKNSIRLEEMINYFKYDYPQPTDEHPFSINLESAMCPWDTNHQIVSVGLQGKIYSPEQLPPANLVFLIDVSGSMQSYDKLPLVKSSLRSLVSQLRKQDNVSMVVYAGNAGLILPSTSGSEKNKILNAINSLEAGGSTAGGEGIKLAYNIAEKNMVSNGNNRIILCTDGDFNVGVSSESELEDLIVSERDKGIYLTVLGYGTGNYKDSKMELLADKGNGNYAYVDSQLEADKVLVREMSGTLYTIAKDVKIQIEFNPSVVKSYRLLGYENRLLKDWEFNDDKRDAGEIGAGHSVTAIYEVEYASTKDSVKVSDLKYQNVSLNSNYTDEVLTIKFRYKRPMETFSNLITKTLQKTQTRFDYASENLRFASMVAAFGMVLRNSSFKGTANLDMIIDEAKKCKHFDEDGDRAEFINLARSSRTLLAN